MDLSLIVPCFNEEENVAALVERVSRVVDCGALGQVELVLVDDGSGDATWLEIERARAASALVVGVRHARNRGLAAAWRTGLHASRGRLVCILDADLQYRPEDVPRLYEAHARGGADVVQGWRSVEGRSRDSRYYISRVLNGLLNRAFAMRLRDNKSGFILCRREVLADLLDHRGRYRYWQILLLVAANARGYRVREVETRFDERRAGRSFLSALPARTMLGALADVGRGVLEYRLGIGSRGRAG